MKIYFCHLANTLANTNKIAKIDHYYQANILTNINDKVENFTREEILLRLTNSSHFVIR